MLLQVVSDFAKEIAEIESVFDAHAPTSVSGQPLDYCPVTDGCVVDMWDAWTRYLRRLYVTSAAGHVWSTCNVSYNPVVPLTEADVLTRLRSLAQQRGGGVQLAANEPKWFVVSSVVPICAALGLSNGTSIVGALGSATVALGAGFNITNPLEEIQQIRNYCAHKSTDMTNVITSQYTSGATVPIYLQQSTSGGSTRFHDWCEALEAIAWDAAL